MDASIFLAVSGLTVALDLAGVQGIGFEDGELGGVGSRSAGRHNGQLCCWAKERDLDEESVYKGEGTTGKRAGHGWSRESYKGEKICYKARDRLSRAGEGAPRGDCERGTIIIVLLRDASWSSQPRMPKAA